MISVARQTPQGGQAPTINQATLAKHEAVILDFKPPNDSQFATFVDDYGGDVYKFCRSLAYSKEEAEDLFQETFLKALEQSSKMKDFANPKGFLFSVTLYLWKSWKRKHAIRNRIAPAEPLDENILLDTDMVDSVIEKEKTRVVQAIVNDLPEKFKIPILLHYSVEMGLADIAISLNLPEGTVKSRLFKARTLIRKGLVLHGYEY